MTSTHPDPPDGHDRLTELHHRLTAGITELTSSAGWRRMLTVASRFHSYSAVNIRLISLQRPDATLVAGYRSWQRLGRQVGRGEHGIAIYRPIHPRRDTRAAGEPDRADEQATSAADRRPVSYAVTHVFDISQTTGEPLPEIRPTLLTGAAPAGLWSQLSAQLQVAGFPVELGDLRPYAIDASDPPKGITLWAEHRVIVGAELPAGQQCKTAAHELGHVLLEHRDWRNDEQRKRAEVEAESVAYIVTTAAGLPADAYSVPYVAGWAGGDPQLVEETAGRVLSVARRVLATAGIGDHRLERDDPAPERPAARRVSRRLIRTAAGRER